MATPYAFKTTRTFAPFEIRRSNYAVASIVRVRDRVSYTQAYVGRMLDDGKCMCQPSHRVGPVDANGSHEALCGSPRSHSELRITRMLAHFGRTMAAGGRQWAGVEKLFRLVVLADLYPCASTRSLALSEVSASKLIVIARHTLSVLTAVFCVER
eukprot:5827125-Pleurochrysis_carterae.AAC.5